MKSIEQRLQELEDDAAMNTLVSGVANVTMTTDYEEFNALWIDTGKGTIHEPFFCFC